MPEGASVYIRNRSLPQKDLLTGTKVLQNITAWAVDDESPHKQLTGTKELAY
jgi:hypothetical protein